MNDSAALSGTAFRLRPGDGESFAWVYTTDFFKETPFVAYFRLKVNDNSSNAEMARISVKGGGTEYGPLSLRGTDFAAPNVYREFPLAFTYHDNPDDVFLIFQFWRSGEADVYVDGVYIFTAPQAIQSPFTWSVPGGNYRGGGVWLRYTDGSGDFTSVEEADLDAERLGVRPAPLLFPAEYGGPSPRERTLAVERAGCDPFTWSVSDDASWLHTQSMGEMVKVSVDVGGLVTATYRAAITVTAEAEVLDGPVRVPVTPVVADEIYHVYLPVVAKR